MTSLLKRIRPWHARLTVLVAAVLAAFLGFLLDPGPAPPRVLSIRYVFSNDAEKVLAPLIAEFNKERRRSNGEVIHVTALVESSGKTAAEMGKQRRPVMWTPASSAWAGLVRDVPLEIRVRMLFESPELVAVWRTEAERLHLGSSIQFRQLADLISTHELEFGHTDPNSSTSGLFAVVSEFSSYSGKRPADVTPEDLSRARVRESVRRLEWDTAHYVDIARDFATAWCRYAVSFASAAYMQETTLIDFNKHCQRQLQAVYVTDFPFVADYPYLVVRGSWVTEDEREAADVFGAWLDDRLAADSNLAKESGFRRGTVVPDAASGADPTQPASPPPPIPDAPVLTAMQEGWSQLRRPANVMLVVDESQQMAPQGKEELAKEALLDFLDCPGTDPKADDRVGMIVFGGGGTASVQTEVPIVDFDLSRGRLEKRIRALAGRDGAALWDAVDRALRSPSLHESAPLRTIVLLATGQDDSSSVDPHELEADLRDSVAKGRPVQVLAVPYSLNVRSRVALRERLVTPSLGRFFTGDIRDVAAVTKFICAYQ